MPNRYMCSALEEMRDQLKLLSFYNIKRYKAITAMLIEEIQTMGNRMEAHLHDNRQLDKLHLKIRKAKQELKRLEEEIGNPVENGKSRIQELLDEIE